MLPGMCPSTRVSIFQCRSCRWAMARSVRRSMALMTWPSLLNRVPAVLEALPAEVLATPTSLRKRRMTADMASPLVSTPLRRGRKPLRLSHSILIVLQETWLYLWSAVWLCQSWSYPLCFAFRHDTPCPHWRQFSPFTPRCGGSRKSCLQVGQRWLLTCGFLVMGLLLL